MQQKNRSAKDAQFAARNFVAKQHRSRAKNVLCTFFIYVIEYSYDTGSEDE